MTPKKPFVAPTLELEGSLTQITLSHPFDHPRLEPIRHDHLSHN